LQLPFTRGRAARSQERQSLPPQLFFHSPLCVVPVKLTVESPGARRHNTAIMPIRFRCGHCNQLMGIGHKKAGTVVRCPTCTSEVTVPQPNAKVSERPKRERQPDVFERSDFDEIFQVLSRPQRPRSLQAASSPADSPSANLAAPAQPELRQVDRPVTFQPTASGSSGQSGSRPAVWLRWRLIAVVALTLVFGAGFLAGMFIERSFHQPSP
jgi:hypothetical protein